MSSIVTRLSASVVGSGPRTIVLANGLGTSQHTWRHVVDALSADGRIVRFDYVGTPDTDLDAYHAARYDSLTGHADDVVALLAGLDVRDALWVGHSVSGMIGAIAAVTAPERIAQLVLVAASPRYLDDVGYAGGFTTEAIDGVLAAAATDFQTWAGGFSPLVIGRADAPDAVEEFASSLRRMRPDVALRTLRIIFTSDYRHVLPHVGQPVTVVQPRDDVAVPVAVGRYLAAALPCATYRELRTMGHIPQLTDPDELIAILREVLAVGGDLTRIAA